MARTVTAPSDHPLRLRLIRSRRTEPAPQPPRRRECTSVCLDLPSVSSPEATASTRQDGGHVGTTQGTAVSAPRGTMIPQRRGAAKPQRSAVILKGQTAQLSFAEPGTYDYICGLHPAMKGKIEVK